MVGTALSRLCPPYAPTATLASRLRHHVLDHIADERGGAAEGHVGVAAKGYRPIQQRLIAVEIENLDPAPLHQRALFEDASIHDETCAGTARRRSELAGSHASRRAGRVG